MDEEQTSALRGIREQLGQVTLLAIESGLTIGTNLVLQSSSEVDGESVSTYNRRALGKLVAVVALALDDENSAQIDEPDPLFDELLRSMARYAIERTA